MSEALSMTGDYDLWVDFQRRRADGLTTTLLRYAMPGVAVVPGTFLIVGSDDSELAAAEVVDVQSDALVSLRVLPGRVSDHKQNVQPPPPSAHGVTSARP